MRKRVIGLLLALCYLSVSLAVFSPHFHEHGKGLVHQCIACAWHSESISDVSTHPTFVAAPVILVKPVEVAEARSSASTLLAPSDRGPPFHS